MDTSFTYICNCKFNLYFYCMSVWHGIIAHCYHDYKFWCVVDTYGTSYSWPGLGSGFEKFGGEVLICLISLSYFSYFSLQCPSIFWKSLFYLWHIHFINFCTIKSQNLLGLMVIVWEMDFLCFLVHESTSGSNLFPKIFMSKNSKWQLVTLTWLV